MEYLIGFTVLVSLFIQPAYSGSGEKPSVDKQTYDVIIAVEKLNAGNKHAQALNRLERFIPTLQAESYDKAISLKLLAYTYLQQESVPEAIRAFEQAIEAKGLPGEQRLDIRRQVANLYLSEEQYAKSLGHIMLVLEGGVDIRPEDHVMAGYALVQQERYTEARGHVETAVTLADTPKISWLQMLSAIYYELKAYREGIDVVLRILAMKPPQPAPYWQQLAAFYSLAADERSSSAVLELAHHQGFFNKPDQIIHLAGVLRYQNASRSAAELLEYAVQNRLIEANPENWQRIGDAWWEAREYDKAIPVYQQLPLSADYGRIRRRVAHYYHLSRQWQSALEWLNRHLSTKGIKDPAETHYLLGLCYLETGETTKARSHFYQALENNPDKGLSEQIEVQLSVSQ